MNLVSSSSKVAVVVLTMLGSLTGIRIETARAQEQPQVRTPWLGGAGSPGLVTPSTVGDGHIGVWLDVPQNAVAPGAHAAMALSLVIDTSGSMRGEKIQHAREAALRFLAMLQTGDIVSVYAFGTTVEEIVAPTPMGPGVADALAPRIRALSATGNTNLHGGLMRGQAAVAAAPETHRIRRIVLISDGRATVEPTSSDALGTLAAEGARRHVAIAAIGVGADYDDVSLRGLATRSAGRLYHVDDGNDLTRAVGEEVALLQRSAATDATVTIIPAPGVTIAGVETVGGQLEGGRATFDVGTVYAAQQRELLVRVHVPSNQIGRHPLAHVVLRYRTLDSTSRAMAPQAAPPGGMQGANESREDLVLSYEVTTDTLAAQGSEQPRVAALIALQSAAGTQLAAAGEVGRGRTREADQQLAQAEQRLRAAAARSRDARIRARLQTEGDAVRERRAAVRAAPASPTARRAASRSMGSAAMDSFGY